MPGLSKDRKEMWGRLVKARRETFGLTQRKLASLLEPPVAQGTIWKIEKGQVAPSDDMKLRLAHALRCRVTDLFPWEDD